MYVFGLFYEIIMTISSASSEYYSLLRQFPNDSVLVIGDSRRASSRHQFAQRINGIDVVEPVDLSDVIKMAASLDDANAANVMPTTGQQLS
jgi:DNA helicase-2/ATP-dependent DNA helicase PcrA